MKISPRFLTFTALAAVLFAVLLGIGQTFGAQAAVVVYLAANALAACPSLTLGVSAITKLADLWIPEVLQEAMAEPVVEKTAFLDSGVVATNAEVVAAASGPGTDISIKYIIDPNHADQQQIEDTAPELRKLASGSQRAAIFNRVSPLAATALAGIISGVKPKGDLLSVILSKVQGLRKRQRNRLVISALKGLYDTGSAPEAVTGAFRALRLDHFSETGAAPAAIHLVDSDYLLDATGLLGENSDVLQGGAALMHSKLMLSLLKQDQIEVIRNSEGKIILGSWKGMTIFPSDLLERAGGVSGKVYSTFLCGYGSIAMGDKPQVVTDLAGEVAALQLDVRDIAKNNVAIYDRTRFICHPQGAKWDPEVGIPAVLEAGPSNLELEDDLNWASGLNDIRNARIVCLRTNG